MENPSDFSVNIKKSFLDGIFYPSNKLKIVKIIKQELNKLLEIQFSGKNFLIPHGAWDFCLTEYIYCIETVRKENPDITVLFLPFHNNYNSSLYTALYQEYLLPNGKINLIQIDDFEKYEKHFVCSNIPFDEQTSLESFLPVLIELFPDCPLLPVFHDCNVSQNTLKIFLEIIKKNYKHPVFLLSQNINQKKETGIIKDIYSFYNTLDFGKTDFCSKYFLSIFLDTLNTELMLPDFYKNSFTKTSECVLHLLYNISGGK